MIEFSKSCKYKNSFKRSLPGCTASQLKYFVMPSLEEDTPDIAIIQVGTNNITKKNQTEADIFSEIMEVVKTCKNGGVNEIYISSLICRPGHQEKINGINRLLLENAENYDYYYINNNNIETTHLWRDKLHLNHQGICILARNFIEYVNRIFIYNSTWV